MVAIAQARFAEETTEPETEPGATVPTDGPGASEDDSQPEETPAHDLHISYADDGTIMYTCRVCGKRRANSSYGLTSVPCTLTPVRAGRPPRNRVED